MPPVAWSVEVRDHPGSSADDIAKEPDWDALRKHRIGFRDDQDRAPGITHQHDEEIERSVREPKDARSGAPTNFRDVVQNHKDFYFRASAPANRSTGWRDVLDTTEDQIKNFKDFPGDVQMCQNGEQEKDVEDQRDSQQEHQWKRLQGETKHHGAYARLEDSGYDSGVEQSGPTDKEETDQEKLHQKYTPQEIALLRNLQEEQEYMSLLRVNDGKGSSPQHHKSTPLFIDERDQFTPDNWLPRSSDLVRLTGKHPLNAEAHLSHLFDAGLITPNELHYVRNHGAVPRLDWEFHKLDIGDGALTLSMDELKSKYSSINIPVALACAGNRRKELNMIKKSKGFNWGAGAVGCAYWKGPLLRDVLFSAGFPQSLTQRGGWPRFWVNFEGADEPSQGKYATCLPYEYAMDPTNDVILAYEMNDVPLPPDHGYPVRLIVPGYIGGRSVKWLKRIWISKEENDSHYHVWDNRVVPSFVTEKDGEFAEALFHHPDTACNEQTLNSVIVKPAQGEKIALTKARSGQSYRIAGYAYDGGGHEVQRVEVSLDGGETWLYCIRQFPDYPIRHGNKFWTWLHWHVDVELSHLLCAKSITARCFNVFKYTQPEKPSWNVLGMMNNSWYVVHPSIVDGEDSDAPSISFKHPVEPGTGKGGWMRSSVDNQLEKAKLEAGTPQKQFTRQEIEKHDREDDCWIVVDGKVYDVTSVLSWHPGGKAAVLGHAGKVHQETSDEFESIHDAFAYRKLRECILGVVTPKAANFIKQTATTAALVHTSPSASPDQLTLHPHHWVPVRLLARHETSPDTHTYTFSLPAGQPVLGLATCQHLQLGLHLRDRMLIRSYTPTRPLLPAPKHHHSSHPAPRRDSLTPYPRDGDGTFDLTVRTARAGVLTPLLAALPVGATVDVRGPRGALAYHGCGQFGIDDNGTRRHFSRVSLVLGGAAGAAAGFALVARVLLAADPTELAAVLVVGGEVMLGEEWAALEREGCGQLRVRRAEGGGAEVLREGLFAPAEGSVVLLCGPERMVMREAVPALREWGYVEGENMFGF
ncbi:hypothetical protein SLS56_008254 [Neofusicoccum ribis]|uniref:Nitrate reductase [NADPH] n=1 Tax=Neofusicoccum ribis TaxID=45134 RepID=A0ABR3SL37_9PEZI